MDMVLVQTDKGILKFNGFNLNKWVACYRESKCNWVIVDRESGLYVVEGIESKHDCSKIFKQIRDKVLKAYNTPKFKKYTKILKDWKNKNNM